MKKLITYTLSIILILSFAVLPTYANETTVEGTRPKAVQNAEQRENRHIKLLENVALYAPELLDDYTEAVTTHTSIHEELQALRIHEHEEYMTEVKANLEILKADLSEQLQADEISYREYMAAIKAFTTEQRATYAATKEALKAEIETWKEAHNIDRQIHIEQLKALKEAIQNEDTASANLILTELYQTFLTHIELDYYKLSLLSY